MKLINFKSKPKLTPFAPEWNYFLIESTVNNIDFKKLTKYLLSKEKEILKLPCTTKEDKVSDGYTGLGKDSVSSRYDKYNVFFWKNKEITILKKNIIEIHDKFLKLLKLDIPKKLYIQSWVNIMRKGEQIKPHIHNTEADTYLGGHICIQCNDTSTIYMNPVNQLNDPETYVSKNEVGKLTLFQSNLPHYTDIHNFDEERITIAFDLFLNKKCDNYLQLI
jgi:hypothetical protein